MTPSLYTTLRTEIADALVNRNRGDLAERLHELDDDEIADGEREMVDHIERTLDARLESDDPTRISAQNDPRGEADR